MRAPIIIDEHGDIEFYDSAEKAQGYLEPIDVSNNEYIAYDSEGRLLHMIITDPPITHRLFPSFFKALEVVDYYGDWALEPAEAEPAHADELRQKLLEFFLKLGEPEEWLQSASLEHLVSRGMENTKHHR